MSFKEMAAEREDEAAELEDEEIYVSILSKFVRLDHPLEMKIEMMLSAVDNNKDLVVKSLKKSIEKQLLPEDKVKPILNELE